ncbi:MAG: hypothetical protein HKO59_09685 [Phycisphaerales bacterium]|nr:hypothetical protein [Phycisphaerae bacterium]NNF41860.1 hypothetical protein [Phycisphaerales bacterium]NNM26234.1 hypothetical protein [Phycisphaerales bacterium]
MSDLSERKAALLERLVEEMDELHQRRRRRRRIAAACGLIVAGTVAATLMPIPSSPTAAVVTAEPEPAPTPDASVPVDAIVRIATDPTVTQRLRIATPHRITRLDDASLLDTLAQIDRPTGLVRSGGRAWLTNAVVDPLPTETPSPSS